MRVGVTGADGFTGRYVTAALRERGDEPVAIMTDVRDGAELKREFRDKRPEALIHLAALAFIQSDDVGGFYAVNQLGAFNVLDAAAATSPDIPVVLQSSAQVYGASISGLVDEGAPLAPANHYALSKAAMELGARWWGDRLRLTVTRSFNYTGVGQEDRYLIPKIVDHFRRRAATIELGNLHVQRDFGDVRAVASALCMLLDRSRRPGIFNISSGRVSSIDDVLRALTELSGHRLQVRVNPAFVREDDVAVLGGDNRRLREALPHWRPIELRDTLRWMLES